MTDSDLDADVLASLQDAVEGLSAQRYRSDLAAGRCRPAWSWVAETQGRVVARAVWWGLPDSDHPLALECLEVARSQPDRAALAVGLLRAGLADLTTRGLTTTPVLTLVLQDGWQSEPAAVEAVAWRREAVRAIGLTDVLERLRFEWTPDSSRPVPSARLVFTAEPDDEVVVEVFQRVARGSLDVETSREISAVGAEQAARDELAFYRSMPGERSWWRLAHTPDGRLAGVALPSRSAYSANVGYLGVVPELRGRGYVDDLLAEITRFHAARGEDRITGSTDTTNGPMAAAFVRAGYRNTERRLQFSAPQSDGAG